MNSREYIESGILELYVFGKLSDEEITEVNQMAAQYPEVRDLIYKIVFRVLSQRPKYTHNQNIRPL